MKTSNSRQRWSRVLQVAGYAGMLLGAIDPMEGSVIILPGSLLVALGTLLGQGNRRWIIYRAWVFLLVAMGVGAMWGLTWIGGIGGRSGHSMWWGVLLLPCLIGWSMGMWGPGSPRWVLWLGIAVGLWYVKILAMVLSHANAPPGFMMALPALVIAATGLLTIGGCLWRLKTRRSRSSPPGESVAAPVPPIATSSGG